MHISSRYLLTLRQTLDEDYVLEKLFEIVLTLQQRFLFRNEIWHYEW